MVCVISSSGTAYAFTASGFQNPYGVAVDPKTNYIYISNVNGGLSVRDGDGFISRLKGDGGVDDLRYIDGAAANIPLDAPKGMAVMGNLLYVADIDKLRVFSLDKVKHVRDIDFGELAVQHLFGVAAGPDGALYVADGPGNAIYRVDVAGKDGVTAFISGEELGQPHGIGWHRQRQLFVVSGFGSGMVKAFDQAGRRQATPGIFLRTIEGLDADDAGNVYVASQALGAVYQISSDFALSSFELGLISPTGVAYNRAASQIIVTSFDAGTVQSFPVKPGASMGR